MTFAIVILARILFIGMYFIPANSGLFLSHAKSTFPRKIYFPTQNLLSDAEVTICKYKWLIINVNAFVLG